MLGRKRNTLYILRAEKRPRQDSNLQPRDWKLIDGYAGSDPECILRIAA